MKIFSVVLLGTGSIGTVFSSHYEDQKRFAYFLAGPGFGLCWAFGVGLTHVSGVSLFSSWIVGSMLLSIVALNAILYAAGKEGRRSPLVSALILVPLAITVVLMVTKPA